MDEFCRHCLKNVEPTTRYQRSPTPLQTPRVERLCPICGTVLSRSGGQFTLVVKTAALLAVIQLAAAGLNALGLPIPKYQPGDWAFLLITAGTALLIVLGTTWLSKRRKKKPRIDTKTK